MIHHLTTECKLTLTETKDSPNVGLISGYASVFGVVDEQGDRVINGAFSRSLKDIDDSSKWPKMLWQHDPKEPIGQWTKIQEDAKGLYVEGQLLLDLQRGREAYALLKSKVIDGLSIGYRVVEAHKSEMAGERLLSQLDLLEVSLVTFAANTAAKITEVKGNTEDHLLQRLGQFAERLRGV